MEKSKIFLLTGLFCIIITSSFSQSNIDDDKAHRRYWYYRARFINDFMKIGKDQSECIVFAERNNGSATGTTVKIGPDQIDLTNIYLATLALEYKLLTRNSQNTDETIKEIYHLMYTINRLDLEADIVFDTYAAQSSSLHLNGGVIDPTQVSNNGVMNGYIMREDFQEDFIANNIADFNYELIENGIDLTGAPSTFLPYGGFSGIKHVNAADGDSKFQKWVDQPFAANSEPCGLSSYNLNTVYEVSLVHDKYYSMLAAFMFITKYIPSNTFYYENGYPQAFQDGTSGIKEQAAAITNRLRNYIRGNTFANNAVDDWVLKQPDGTNICYFSGAGMTEFSFTTDRAVCHINDGYPWAWTDNCLSYSDPVAASAGLLAYQASGGSAQFDQDQAVFMAWNQAFSNYPVGLSGCWNAMTSNTGTWNLFWAELVREVLFETHPINVSMGFIESPIAIAPCSGPQNFGSGEGGPEWSGQDRTEHPDSRAGSGFLANYPGVDYMFLHNLFYEYLNQQSLQGEYLNAYNLMDNYDEQTWPQEALFNVINTSIDITAGVDANTNTLNNNTTVIKTPAYIKEFQYLSSRAQIYAAVSPMAPTNTIGSRVEYRAGKEIVLLPENGNQPGFKVDQGSEFSAYVKRYLCSDGDYGNGLRTTQNGSVNDFETDNMNTIIPIHHVNHPLSASDLNPGPQPEFPSDISIINTINKTTRKNEEHFNILPNPNNGYFKIECTKATENEVFVLSIIDVQGNMVMQYDSYTTRDLDLTNFPKGIYLVRVSSNTGYNQSKKVNIAD